MERRVAVVVVHGVADQLPGETVRSVVELLTTASPGGACYSMVDSQEFTLPVPPLSPASSTRLADGPADSKSPLQALVRSCKSDLARDEATGDDPGITLTTALLGQYAEAVGESCEAYGTKVIRMSRRKIPAAGERLDVFEMYWADLSRLSGSVPRIVSEVFTLIFRLARLGRDTVAEAFKVFGKEKGIGGLGWRAVRFLQSALDWTFVHVLAMLTLHLALLGGVLVGLGLLPVEKPKQVFIAALVAAGTALVCAYWTYYSRSLMAPRVRIALLSLLAASVAAVVWREVAAPYVLFGALLATATALNVVIIRMAAVRFNLAPAVSMAMWSLVLVAVAFSGASQWGAEPAAVVAGDVSVWVRSVVFAIELLLYSMKALWIGLGIALALWFICGAAARRVGGYEAEASIATGRLGLGAALAGFLMLTMVVWAALTLVFGLASEKVSYAPCLFPVEAVLPNETKAVFESASQVARSACVLTSARANPGQQSVSAAYFLASRYFNSTMAFALVAIVVVALLAYLIAMVIPSVLAEAKVLRASPRTSPQANRLGHWLTYGYRYTDLVVTCCFGLGVFWAVLVAAVYLEAPVLELFGVTNGTASLAELSQTWLKPFVLSAASLGATLILLGGFLSRRLPAIRGPLDIALDVDNHFRAFPAKSVPRARIFSRYAALLDEIRKRHAEEPYDRIVIVAHSQGTVLSAELLRYLCSDGKQVVKQAPENLPPIHLLTFGCPLRQLYAARFPTLYGWVLRTTNGVSGPRAAAIGVERWANAFCAGDYVGRWLWSENKENKVLDSADVIGHPMMDAPADPLLGRINAYAAFAPWPPTDKALARAARFEMCLGLGAHTHYFDIDQHDTAWLIDHVIATPWVAASPAGGAPAPQVLPPQVPPASEPLCDEAALR